MKVITTERVPIKIWATPEGIEPTAMAQVKNLASLPFIFKHIALMPDAHWGNGTTVGSVIATDRAVIPAAIGVDIGCGMIAARTDLDPDWATSHAKEIREAIEAAIPVGFECHKAPLRGVFDWKERGHLPFWLSTSKRERAWLQLGTLGGGNHFIELALGEDRAVWIVLHSGSRHVGKVVADRHIGIAKDLMKQMFISLPDPELAYLVRNTPEYRAYLRDMEWCQEYAAFNRELLLDQVVGVLDRMLQAGFVAVTHANCHHNYAAMENHFGQNILVTRKGAVRARVGDIGVIPGSMGTKSYIVRGLGNPESFMSCSHGAGRAMGRKEAKRRFTAEDLEAQTTGVECRKDPGVVDEIPAAYKDIDQVMAAQADLVEVTAVLKQFICVKG